MLDLSCNKINVLPVSFKTTSLFINCHVNLNANTKFIHYTSFMGLKFFDDKGNLMLDTDSLSSFSIAQTK